MEEPDSARLLKEWRLGAEEAGKVCARARADVTAPAEDGSDDTFVWEHTVRMAASIPEIMRISGIAPAQVDRLGLFAGALYHCAGWTVQVRDGSVCRFECLSKPTSDVQRELGAALAEERLPSLADEHSLRVASLAVRRMNDRTTDMLEAQLLGEAEGLDEVGPLFFWQMVRHQAAKGQGIEAFLDAWKSKREYRFWNARLNRFRFEPVRRVARRRLSELERFSEAVTRQARHLDLKSAVPALKGRRPRS